MNNLSIGMTARLCCDSLGSTSNILIVKEGKVAYEPPYDISPARWDIIQHSLSILLII